MGRSSKAQSQARRQRRAESSKRRRGGIQRITLTPRDAALVIRSRGTVEITQSRGPVVVGSNTFWMMILKWLFAADPDAAERRQILQDDFLTDVQEKMNAARLAKYREIARGQVEALGLDPESEEFASKVDEIVADMENEHQKTRDATAQAGGGELDDGTPVEIVEPEVVDASVLDEPEAPEPTTQAP